ncbi:PAS domain-containing sensor histidine kinase [Ideonella paludis]|uniref:histidine kinase n=1 Tax=Ideonella paludis TaxID=1233411 RepID=A0ABS5E0L6_9BURK|nr:PAS domain-containing protein [Ideonella paludis]MBQ0936869.1 PAS domain-containing protein [Ideonella paludis]
MEVVLAASPVGVQFMEHWHLPAFAADTEGHLVWANAAFAQAFEDDLTHLLGSDLRAWVSAWQGPTAWQTLSQSGAASQACGLVCFARPQRQPLWMEVSCWRVVPDALGPIMFVASDMTAQRGAQERLSESNDRLRIALEGGNDGLWDWLDTHSQDMWWSPEFVGLLGYEAGEIEPSLVSFDSLLHPDDQEATFTALAQALEGGAEYRVEFRLLTKAGGYRWFRSRAKVLRDEHGEHRRMAGSLQDIDDLKRSQERLDLALEGGSQALWDWLDTHSQTMWWSPQFYRMLGYSPGEISADLAVFDTLVHEDDQASYFEALGGALDDAPHLNVECRLKTKSGAYRWFKLLGKVFRDGSALHSRIAGSMHDIDDSKRIQADIRRRQEELGAIAAISPDGFLSFDEDYRLRFSSDAVGRLTGLDVQAAMGQTLQAVLQTLSQLSTQADLRLDEATLHEGSVQTGVTASPGRTVEFSWHQAVTAAGGASEGSDTEGTHLLRVRDVTVELEAEQIKADFLTAAAHELRTPLASVYGYTELLLNYDMPPERQKKMLATIYRQCEVLMTIVNELLDMARIDARGGQAFDLEPVDLHLLVSEVISEYPVPPDRLAPLLEAGPGPWVAQSDPTEVKQVLRNLLSNAYKYSAAPTPVVIRLGTAATLGGHSGLSISVCDQGIGMDAEQLGHATERFWRADKSGHVPGAGLGLSLAQEVAELLRGQLVLNSTLGEGTQAQVLLPMA